MYQCYRLAFKRCLTVKLSRDVFHKLIWGKNWLKVYNIFGISLKAANRIHAVKSEIFRFRDLNIDNRLKLFTKLIMSDDCLFVTAGSIEAAEIKLKSLIGSYRFRLVSNFDKTNIPSWKILFKDFDMLAADCMLIDDNEDNCYVAKSLGVLVVNWRLV